MGGEESQERKVDDINLFVVHVRRTCIYLPIYYDYLLLLLRSDTLLDVFVGIGN